MAQEVMTCPRCQNEFTPRRHRGARWVIAGTGAVLGGVVTDSLLGGVLFGVLAYGAAMVVDEYRARKCPVCHTITFKAVDVSAPMPAAPAHH